MAVEIKGLDSLMRKLDAMGGNVMGALKKATKETTLAAQGSAKYNAPVDTGNLRLNVNTKFEDSAEKTTGIVYDNVEYAVYQELGTVNMAAQPYMMPALEENKGTFENLAKKHLKDAINKLGG